MTKQPDWAGEVAAWRTSGLAARQFCEGRGYSATRLYWWSSQLKRMEGATKKKSIPLARVVRRRDGERSGLRGTPIIVQVGQARVEVTADADRAALSIVLEALAAAWGARS
jgi:transposase